MQDFQKLLDTLEVHEVTVGAEWDASLEECCSNIISRPRFVLIFPSASAHEHFDVVGYFLPIWRPVMDEGCPDVVTFA